MSDNTFDLTTSILLQIRQDIAALNAKMDAGFDRMDRRFDNMIETMGGEMRNHGERLAKLERGGPRRRPTSPRGRR